MDLLTEQFQNLTTKFLFLNCCDGKNKSENNELNMLLNDLNSLNYETAKLADSNAAIRLIESFSNVPANQETLIVKSCCLITVLLNKQKIQLSSNQFENTMNWLTKCLQFNYHGATEILSAMQAMFKNHSQFCQKFWDQLLYSDGLLFGLLNESKLTKQDYKNYDTNSFDETIYSTLICIESLLLFDTEVDDKELELLSVIGTKLLNLIYSNKIKIKNFAHSIVALTSALNILNKIASANTVWCENHLGELIGISKAFMNFGLPGINDIVLQKVLSSQQSVFESSLTTCVDGNKGGKVAKTRKPRTVNKNKKDSKQKNKTACGAGEFRNDENSLNHPFDIENPYSNSFATKTSDSDFSESESGRAQNEKRKNAKLRLSALSLIGILAKNVDKKHLYGYWHSLFPSEISEKLSTGLLNTVLHDSNARCRIQALQVACVLFYGSKAFLYQAENSEKPPTSFMPFSISLGNMIVSIYNVLTQAMASENSIPVLTQILKCLTVLIQATPFTRLKNGFVTDFVKYIRKLVYHKDTTIQVAALMVMEFLISSQEFSSEISECVGIPKGKLNTGLKINENKLNDSGVEEIIEVEFNDDEIEYDSDCEVLEKNQNEEINETIPSIAKMSWLLQKVLENLGVIVGNLKVKLTVSSTPVRIESLNVLTTMASHFLMLKSHIQLIAAALKISLVEDQPEIRLSCAKCLDAFGHAINTYLLENPKNEEIVLCQSLWLTILPCVIEKVQDQSQNATLKGVLCDFMSNIGVHIFERLTHTQQMQLISLLSGMSCNEENAVRASAVRALAVYVFFPSLREDLCFFENTAESIIKLMKDKNSYVRIKSSWSLGNISDALISNCLDSQLDRISDDLLMRLLEITIESANDNDKVKCNAVRTIGNLLRLITDDQLKLSVWRSICLKAIEKLINCMNTGGNAKVKWNSCYAIGNFMKNPSLYINIYQDQWQKLVFPSVCNLIINSTNFKVRINGAASLIVINDRKLYGNYFISIWISLLSAMEQSDNLTDFNEYKHRDNLQEQLCLCISHIIKISTIDDLILLKNQLTNVEIIQKLWIRVTNRIIPENSKPLIDCWVHLKQLLQNENLLNADQKKSVQIISNCFISPVEKLD